MKLRRLIVFAHDVLAAGLAWIAAFWLRFNFDIPADYQELMLRTLPWVLGIHAARVLGCSGSIGVFGATPAFPDLQRIAVAIGIAALGGSGRLRARTARACPCHARSTCLRRSFSGSSWGATGSPIAPGARGAWCSILTKPQATPVLVLGAGLAASGLLRELASSPQWRVVGMLDDDAKKHGASVGGVKIYGGIERVGEIARRLGVSQAVIAMPSATHQQRQRALDLCAAADLQVMTVPSLSDIVSGRVSVSALRAVELDDLLGRDPVELDDAALHSFLEGKSVLVTGAGGSIGSELCRQIARYAPGAPRALRHLGVRALFDRAGVPRPVPGASTSPRSSATRRTRAGSARCSLATGRRSCSMPRRTSTCR